MTSKPAYKIVISSSFNELVEHRRAVMDMIVGQGMLPLVMETDSAIPRLDPISSSLAKVDEADAYIGLIGYRYGNPPVDHKRNPEGFSLTELEFRHAVKRDIPICMFIMSDDHDIKLGTARQKHVRKLRAFKALTMRDRIYTTFNSIEELKTKATKSLQDIRATLDSGFAPRPVIHPVAADAGDPRLPEPPTPYEKPRYIPGYKFVGRENELKIIDKWAATSSPVLIFEAIGGMGKSMLTWNWFQERADKLRNWEGMLWYSFYEPGANMHDFCVTALAYITRRNASAFRIRKTSDLSGELLRHLQARPWLLVLDGLERVLVAYHRVDAPHMPDTDVEADPDRAGRMAQSCVRPVDDELLRMLAGAEPSKILVSSRLMPLAFLNRFGVRCPGVDHIELQGLAPDDAEAMVRGIGIRGLPSRIRSYLTKHFGCHPLVVGMVAGLVYFYVRDPGNFDLWVDDPQGGDEVNLATLDLSQRSEHILKIAFADLDTDSSELLSRLALVSQTLDWNIIEALNPKRPPPPANEVEPTHLDDDEDYHVQRMKFRIHDATTDVGRQDLENSLESYRTTKLNRFNRRKEEFASYQKALEDWQKSDALRAGEKWLVDVLPNLERRGLIQSDRATGTRDLHPVVRRYALDLQSQEARALTGKKVADYFSTRTDPPYEKAASLGDLSNGIQVARALNAGGLLDASSEILEGGLFLALNRLELYHDWLSLLRPFFPDGWDQPPSVGDRAFLAGEASIPLHNLDRTPEALALLEFELGEHIANNMLPLVTTGLRGVVIDSRELGRLATAERINSLLREVAQAVDSKDYISWCDGERISSLLRAGKVQDARTLWDESQQNVSLRNTRFQAGLFVSEIDLLFSEKKLADGDIEKAIVKVKNLGWRAELRQLLRYRGALLRNNGDYQASANVFGELIEMERAIEVNSSYCEASYAFCLFKLGREREAKNMIAKALESKRQSHIMIARVCQMVGDIKVAREQAVAGYREAWGDGEPYWEYDDIDICRELLAELGEPEPNLPPFDAASMKPFPFEAGIRALLEDHKKKSPKS
ncbi:MAG TPA: DUF4062 domain-containing protein [Rhizomicrobium sp.]